jgi:ADP-ribose pyrophosphatase YjhB (NUDIX family)
MFTIGVFALILDEERRVLFCHRRDRDLWNLPGGRVRANEAPWEDVVREVKEEVGLTVIPERIIDISSKLVQREIVLTFLCSVVRGKPTLSDEADEIAFFSFSELPEKISPRQRERVEDFFQNPDGIVWRKH